MGGGSARKEGGSHWKGTKGTYTVCRLDVKRTKIAKIVHLTARIRAALSVLAATAACLLLQQQLLSSLLLANVAHETGLGKLVWSLRCHLPLLSLRSYSR